MKTKDADKYFLKREPFEDPLFPLFEAGYPARKNSADPLREETMHRN